MSNYGGFGQGGDGSFGNIDFSKLGGGPGGPSGGLPDDDDDEELPDDDDMPDLEDEQKTEEVGKSEVPGGEISGSTSKKIEEVE